MEIKPNSESRIGRYINYKVVQYKQDKKWPKSIYLVERKDHKSSCQGKQSECIVRCHPTYIRNSKEKMRNIYKKMPLEKAGNIFNQTPLSEENVNVIEITRGEKKEELKIGSDAGVGIYELRKKRKEARILGFAPRKDSNENLHFIPEMNLDMNVQKVIDFSGNLDYLNTRFYDTIGH